ncbi:hypothetical protein FGB62_2g19 [Gracilaria domingensis]|nr:hypothetical protein FGB62_2g19 [Gracilaria domingensis]
MGIARRYITNLLLELYAELSTLIPCYTDAETFERALLSSWFQGDVKNIRDRFYHLAHIVYGENAKRCDHTAIPKHISSSIPIDMKGLSDFEHDIDIHRVVKYGDWFLQYLKDAESTKRVLNRHLAEADSQDRFYTVNFSKCPRDELQRYMKAYEKRTHKRSLVFWARDFEVSMSKSRVSISKVKNAVEDWLSDEQLGKATITSDGIETRVVYAPRKRKNENIPFADKETHPRKLPRYREDQIQASDRTR